jgi:hypothetical protein
LESLILSLNQIITILMVLTQLKMKLYASMRTTVSSSKKFKIF